MNLFLRLRHAAGLCRPFSLLLVASSFSVACHAAQLPPKKSVSAEPKRAASPSPGFEMVSPFSSPAPADFEIISKEAAPLAEVKRATQAELSKAPVFSTSFHIGDDTWFVRNTSEQIATLVPWSKGEGFGKPRPFKLPIPGYRVHKILAAPAESRPGIKPKDPLAESILAIETTPVPDLEDRESYITHLFLYYKGKTLATYSYALEAFLPGVGWASTPGMPPTLYAASKLKTIAKEGEMPVHIASGMATKLRALSAYKRYCILGPGVVANIFTVQERLELYRLPLPSLEEKSSLRKPVFYAMREAKLGVSAVARTCIAEGGDSAAPTEYWAISFCPTDFAPSEEEVVKLYASSLAKERGFVSPCSSVIVGRIQDIGSVINLHIKPDGVACTTYCSPLARQRYFFLPFRTQKDTPHFTLGPPMEVHPAMPQVRVAKKSFVGKLCSLVSRSSS